MFRRDVLLEVGGYDEDMEEPIFGDELNLAFKIHKHGYTCVINNDCKAQHFGKYVSKQLDKNEEYFENCCFNDIYVCSKHLDILGLTAFSHMLYRIIWGISWSYRTRNLKTAIYSVKGVLKGFTRGLKRLIRRNGVDLL